jgi:hypothetical protein
MLLIVPDSVNDKIWTISSSLDMFILLGIYNTTLFKQIHQYKFKSTKCILVYYCNPLIL